MSRRISKCGPAIALAAMAGTATAQPSADPTANPTWLPGTRDLTASETATPGKLVLTMARAVELAQHQQPALRQARANVEAAQARVDASRVALRPTANIAASAAAGSVAPHPCPDDPTRTCGGFFDATSNTGLSASASWKITDFGLTAATVRAAQANADAAAAGVITSQLDVRRDVEVAYLEAVARQRLVGAAEATVASEDAHLDQAKRFVAAQAKDPIEVAQAASRAANARSALAQATANEAVALANLRAAIGWIDPTRQPVVDPSWPTPNNADPQVLGQLVASARSRRPEIVQLDKQIAAADAGVTAARAERRPVLAAQAQTTWSPDNHDWTPQPLWSAALTLTWPLWDGGRSRADVRLANANLAAAIAQRDQLLVQLTAALESSRAEIVSNRANVQASTEAVSAAQAQLRLAEARYAQGLGSQIELADAQTAVTTASGNLIQAQWQLATAWATLRRALGVQ